MAIMRPSRMTLVERAMRAQARHCGLEVDWQPADTIITDPARFDSLFPATGGALYGRASHGWMASFQRPGARTRGTGTLPGGGQRASGAGRADGGALRAAGGGKPDGVAGFDAAVPSGGYRWWYLDGLSDDGRHGLTIIGFVGSVFSPYYARARAGAAMPTPKTTAR